jgi:hypothetical protein
MLVGGKGVAWVPISLNYVFDASLVPETCLELSSLPVCGTGIQASRHGFADSFGPLEQEPP